MPADRTGLYIEMVKSFNSGWIHFGNPGTEKFHGPTTIKAFAQDLLKKSDIGDVGKFTSDSRSQDLAVGYFELLLVSYAVVTLPSQSPPAGTEAC